MWVENQVSLGTGKAIMAKTCFEGWLWDLTCAEIKHIQSDKGFFAACAEKHQSYLRVFQELLLINNMLMLSMLFNNYVHRASLHVTCFTSLV